MKAALLCLCLLTQAAWAQDGCRVQVSHNRPCQFRFRRLVGDPKWKNPRVLSADALRSEIELPLEAVELEASDSSGLLFLYTVSRQLRADPGSVQLTLEPGLRPWVLPLAVAVLAGFVLLRLRRRQRLRESSLNVELEQSRQDLQQKEILDSRIWEFASGMAETSGPTALCEYTVAFLRGSLAYDSAAIVDCSSGRARILAKDSPEHPQLDEVALQCSRSQKPTWLLGRKIVAAHPFSLLFPVGRSVVLYAGRARAQHLEESENVLVGAIAAQLRLALRISQTFQENQERLVNLMESSKSAAVGQLAAGLAHELNTPLGAISLLLERALVVRKDPERLETQLTRAHQSIDKAKAILARLLFYSREGSQTGQSVDLNQVIQDTVGFLRSEFTRLKIDLRTSLQPLPMISGNAQDLQQCLVNLLMNAQAATAGSGVVELRSLASEGRVRVWVEDSGTGIAAEFRERIFEPFFTTRPVGQGVGLGLCVARRIAENHRGQLTLEVSDEPGCCFLLDIPV